MPHGPWILHSCCIVEGKDEVSTGLMLSGRFHQFATDQSVDGILVSSDNGLLKQLTTAIVTLNGEKLPLSATSVPGYDVSNLDIKPGQKLALEIILPNRNKPIRLEFSCPQFDLKNPGEGSLISGGPLKVQWSEPLPAGKTS